MLEVLTRVHQSHRHGLGLFAGEKIMKGRIVWRFDPAKDIRIPKMVVDRWHPKAREQAMHFCYVNKTNLGFIVLCGDNSIFLNFNCPLELPNLMMGDPIIDGEHSLIAARNIHESEELTVSIDSDHDALRKLSEPGNIMSLAAQLSPA